MTDNLANENNETAAQPADEKFIIPVARVNETADGYRLELEMPGVNKEGLEISVENHQLSITGRKNATAPSGTLVHRESQPANYRRLFEIDSSIDRAKISARISQGVVTLALPKAEEVKPRKIAVA